jgi:cell division protein ZapA
MADVKLDIAGRVYDLHCSDGQEERLAYLATIVDAKARGMRGGTEVRQLLFAALMLADEAQETQAKVEKAEPQSDSLRAAVALAESREATARDELREAAAREQALRAELREAGTREQTLRAELEAAPQSNSLPPARPSNDRALLEIADRIEALATKVEQIA